MKLIVVRNNFEEASLAKQDTIIINTLPDTAFLKDGKPFFIPDFANPCHIEAHLAVRICRLGRSISKRFAHRYYDAVTVGATFVAENIKKECQEKSLPWELATGFDNAAPVGTFIPLYKELSTKADMENWQLYVPLPADIQFRLTKNGETIFQATSGNMIHHIDEIIAYISQYYTMRQGDIIYLGSPAPSVPVNINDKIEGFLNEEQVLRFNVK